MIIIVFENLLKKCKKNLHNSPLKLDDCHDLFTQKL